MSEKNIQLIVGLGNPGAEYEETRHNVGFMALDVLLEKLGGDTGNTEQAAREQKPRTKRSLKTRLFNTGGSSAYSKMRCNALTYELDFEDKRIVLAKPHTFMNRSGQSVKGLLKHYQLELDELLVIHDDLDLPAATLRVKVGGGAGGHNGIRSIIDSCGADFARIKVGIGRPPGQMPADKYVLQALRSDALENLGVDARRSAEIALAVLSDGLLAAQNTYNGQD
ncbi:MAG: aminoacyl-tRNA hydrolase [Coriobacteriales bacterium]|jgi:PTH1 family peptidyl-tRNA hydrolase|nr:aminoacyl-tRNA hydrolase [Coriobacteriales bacterium]